MYPVEQGFYNETRKAIQRCCLRGTLNDNIPFMDTDIAQGTYSITGQSTESSKVTVGTVYTKTLKMTLLHGVWISRGQWLDKKITVEQGVEISGEPSYIPMGVFFVAESVWTPKGISLKAYDAMMKFDKDIDFNTTSGAAYSLLSLACTRCGVELGMTQAEVEAMPNGTSILNLTEGDNIQTWRDLLSEIAYTLGGYAEIYRDGKLYIRNYHQTIDDTITRTERFKAASFSDFNSYFSTISVINKDDGAEKVYTCTGASANGLKMELGQRPMLNQGTEVYMDAMRQNVADAVGKIAYAPFSAQVLSSFYYDLGDVIKFPGGIGDDCIGCIMSITYTFSATKLSGFGENPALQNSKSATSKAISNLSRAGKSNELTYYTFVNAESKTIDTSEVSLYSLRFSTAQRTTVEWWHEMKVLADLDGASSQALTLAYYLDDELMDYEPADTWNINGYHTVHLGGWFENVEPSTPHTFEVRALVDGGEVSLGIGDLHVLLKGQAMNASDTFDGTITLTDDITPFLLGRLIASLTESTFTLDSHRPMAVTVNDTIYTYTLGRLIAPLEEGTVSLRLALKPFAIVSDDGLFTIVDDSGMFTLINSDGG